jgi:sugar lactone lactonase YvrE
VDAAGNVYVADAGNSTIRKITSAGVVTTLAGKAGEIGTRDGTGGEAAFFGPTGVAVDGSGNVFVADNFSHTIRKITSAGVVTTFAGVAGNAGSQDGTGNAARFAYPMDVAVDGSGNVFVADWFNNTLRKITSSGVVTTLAGAVGVQALRDGTGSDAWFGLPSALSVDSDGNVIVADTANQAIRKVTPAGVVTTLVGAGLSGSADGTVGVARFNQPKGIALDSRGNLYVADMANHTIRKIAFYAELQGATGDKFTIASVETGHAGVYECLVNDATGLVVSSGAVVAVNGAVDVAPLITVQPTSQAVITGSSFTLTVRAVGSGTWTYQWRKGGVDLSGATAATYEVMAAGEDHVGNYDCVVTSAVGTATSTVAAISLTMPSAAIVGGTVSLAIFTQSGSVSCVATSLPPGLTLNRSTGVLGGTPTKGGTYTVTFTLKDGAAAAVSQRYRIEVASLAPGTVGVFHGLIERNPTLNGHRGARIQLTTTASGMCSGSIVSGYIPVPFRGKLSAAMETPTQAALSVVIPALGGTLQLSLDGTTNTLTGTLSDGVTNTVAVNAWRNAWNQTAGKAAKFKGLHTFYLEQGNPDVALPQGYGYGAFTVHEITGGATVVGRLSDGSGFSAGTFVGQAGQVALYMPLYANRGSFTGKLTVTPGANAPVDNVVEGTPSWFKPATLENSKDTLYRAGFGPRVLTAAGGAFKAVAPGQRLLGLPAVGNNAVLQFTRGGLEQEVAEFQQILTVSNPGLTGTRNTAVVPANEHQIQLATFGGGNGLIGGRFALAGSASGARRVTFNGQIVSTIAGGTRGYGFFLLPQLHAPAESAANVPKLSGRVILEAAP